MSWLRKGPYIFWGEPPHKEPVFPIEYSGRAIMAKWTEQFDCSEQTEFWWVILDKPFDIMSVKAKRRYEINKGVKNFYTEKIIPLEYREELYNVYCESLEGYKKPAVQSKKDFYKCCERWSQQLNCSFFGVFSRKDNCLCGYSDCWMNSSSDRKCIAISSLKTRVSAERDNVNFALIYGITEYFNKDIENGAYLYDGSRTVLHETHFQDFLIKYFGFRKAYCYLRLEFRGIVKALINILFPIRQLIPKVGKVKQLCAVLTLYAWSKGLKK